MSITTSSPSRMRSSMGRFAYSCFFSTDLRFFMALRSGGDTTERTPNLRRGVRRRQANRLTALVGAAFLLPTLLDAQDTFASGLTDGERLAGERAGFPIQYIMAPLAGGLSGALTAESFESHQDVALHALGVAGASGLIGFLFAGFRSSPPDDLLPPPGEHRDGFVRGYSSRWRQLHQQRALLGALLAGSAYALGALTLGEFDEQSGVNCRPQSGVTVCTPASNVPLVIRFALP